MKKIFFIFVSIIICNNEIPISPEVSSSYYGIKENHIYSYGKFTYNNQFIESNFIYGDAIFFNNIISRKFNLILLGDMNNDGVINIVDVVSIVNIILGNSEYNSTADYNGDEIVNVVDIIAIINIILN
tara:strand:- start:185 stop:568 length:384 start_codon:yes stop_codon:yes gene_type:complete